MNMLKEMSQARYAAMAPALIKALQRRHFEAYYCANASEALAKLLELIPAGDLVSWGGSVSLDSLGVPQKLKESGYACLDRAEAKTPEERRELARRALVCDSYLMSANALSADGVLINIDGVGNRVAALCFGPRQIIVLCGMNKVCATEAEAEERARQYAAPLNARRVGAEQTPCFKTGLCHDCHSDDCICCALVKTRHCRPKARIKVLLVAEDLGF